MELTLEQRLTQAELLCQKAGVRLTPIRKELLALIYSHRGHLSAYELLRLFRQTHPKAEAMTVYRTLDFLQEQHLVHRVASQNAYTACEMPQHSHRSQLLLCEQCGQTEEINLKTFEKILNSIAKDYLFTLSEKPVEITGICKNCFAN